MRPVRLLHVYPRYTGSADPLTARGLTLIDHFGARAEHFLLLAEPPAAPLPLRRGKGISVDAVTNAPPVSGSFSVRRYRALADFMRGFHLVLTHQVETLDLALARTLFAGQVHLPPVIHHEHDADAVANEALARRAYRILALARTDRLIVPDAALATIAQRRWQQPAGRIALLADPLAKQSDVKGKPVAAPEEKALKARYMGLYGQAMRRRDFGDWEE